MFPGSSVFGAGGVGPARSGVLNSAMAAAARRAAAARLDIYFFLKKVVILFLLMALFNLFSGKPRRRSVGWTR